MQTNELLHALRNRGAAIHGGPGFGADASATGSVPSASFDSLLEEARAGSATGLSPVKIGKGVGIELTADQLNRVAAATDMAEANGAQRAIVLVDGRALEVDVAQRTITGEATGKATASMPSADAVVSAPLSAAQLAEVQAAPTLLRPPSVNINGLAALIHGTGDRSNE